MSIPQDLVVSLEDFTAARLKVKRHRREKIIPLLENLDTALTAQWVTVSSAKTASAGLAVGGAVMLFIFPPVGIGLGLTSAGLGVASGVGDFIGEKINESFFKDAVNEDEQNIKTCSRAATKFQQELGKARVANPGVQFKELMEKIGEKTSPECQEMVNEIVGYVSQGFQAVHGGMSITMGVVQLCKIVNMSAELTEGTIRVGYCGVTMVEATAAGAVTVTASVTKGMLAGAGALISVADATASWLMSKNIQNEVRSLITKLEKEDK